MQILNIIKVYIQLKIDATALKEFKTIIKETVENAMEEVMNNNRMSYMVKKSDDELLTRKQVMEMLGISHATLHNYQKNDILPYLKIGNRVYFKKRDIINNSDLLAEPSDY